MTTQKKKGMTREQAAELYRDLQKAMAKMKLEKGAPKSASTSGIDAKAIAASISAAMKRDNGAQRSRPTPEPTVADAPEPVTSALPVTRGQYAAFVFVIVFAIARVSMSVMEAMNLGQATLAEASMKQEIALPEQTRSVKFNPQSTPGLSREEVKILTTLDSRRAELEERAEKLDERQADLDRREREMAVRLTQLKELTDKLASERDKNEKKKNAQLEQLANVYGSMNPPEAAALIEQLDVTIALSLIERMPEKRIGQILALMRPERALSITKMLSAKGQ